MEQSDLDLLQMAPPYHLQAVLKFRRITTAFQAMENETSAGAASAVAESAQQLFASEALRTELQGLEELPLKLLRELVWCGGRANSRDLALYFQNAGLLAANKPESAEDTEKSPTFEPARAYIAAPQYPAAHPHGVFEQAVRHLLLLGLLFWGKQTNFAGRDYTSGVHDGVLIVPESVQALALELWGTERDQRAREHPQEVSNGAANWQRTLYLYWSLVAGQREGLTLLSNGLLSRPALRQVLDAMLGKNHNEPVRLESDFPRLLFMRLLLQKLGLLHIRKHAVHVSPAEEFFALPLLERVRRCLRLYLESSFWNEMAYLPDVNVRPGPAPLEAAHEEVIRARRVIVERLLKEQAAATWVPFPAFIARCKLYVPYLLFPRQFGPRAERYSSNSNPYNWDFRLRRGWLTHREGWHMVEGGFIRTLLSGPLSWLGLVELDHAEQPSMFDIPTSAIAMTEETPVASQAMPWGRLIVQPNFELVALAPVSEVLLIKLDRFAERVSLERVAQYRLTKASVTRAIQSGLQTAQIQADLEAAAGGDIPQNVSYSLSEWERQARRVEFWPSATLLEVDDEALLDVLMVAPETRGLFKRRLAPRLVEVAAQQLPAVQEILWQRGYLPALTPAPTQGGAYDGGRLVIREPQWQLHADGRLQPLHAVNDLFLHAEVLHFSARDDASGWQRITASTIQQACSDGIALNYIVRFLQEYCIDGIPGSLLIRLKLWGGGYGERNTIAVEHAPLLRLPEPVLHDLQADEDLKALLGDEVAADSRFIHVSTADLERVVEILRQRGFTME